MTAPRLRRIAIPAAIGVLVFCGRLAPVLQGGGLLGRHTYDPFVYYTAAVGLWSGRLPYRDFLLLHPPGMLLALLPFAGLGAIAGDPVGMAAARLAMMLTGAASAVLIYYLLRPRGLAAAVVGAGLYAVWFPALYTERDIRLEGLAGFLVLAGMAVVQRWRPRRGCLPPLLAGALFGAAAVVKLWGVVGVAVLIGWLWWQHGRRQAGAAAVGAGLAATQLMLPFATVLPQFLQLAVVGQLGRDRRGASPVRRLTDLLGLAPAPPSLVPLALAVALALAVIALGVAWRTPEGRLPGMLAVAGSAVLLAVPTWYPHYPALVAGPLCLIFGQAVGAFTERLPRPAARRVLLGGIVAGLAAAQALGFSQSVGRRFPGAELAAVLAPRPGCVTTDRPAALVLSDTLRRNLARGCPLVADPLGYRFAAEASGAGRRTEARRFARFLTDYLGSGASAVLVVREPAELGRENAERIASWPVVGSAGRHLVREPIPALAGEDWREALDSIHPRTEARNP